jgi:hypothetical protein
MAKNKKTVEEIVKEETIIEATDATNIPAEETLAEGTDVKPTEDETDTTGKENESDGNTEEVAKEDVIKETIKSIPTGRRVVKSWNGVFY